MREGLMPLVAILLGGCQAITAPDPMDATQFYPSEDGESFTFRAQARLDRPLEDDEPERIGLLGRWLLKTGLCPNGYVVEGRRVTNATTEWSQIFYTGRCKPAPSREPLSRIGTASAADRDR
jgi:hypothetical protein